MVWAGQALRGGSSQGAWEEDGKTNPGYFCGKHAWRARPTPGTVWAPAMLEGSPHPRDSVGTRHAAVLFYSHHRSRCCCELSSFQRCLRFGEEQ